MPRPCRRTGTSPAAAIAAVSSIRSRRRSRLRTTAGPRARPERERHPGRRCGWIEDERAPESSGPGASALVPSDGGRRRVPGCARSSRQAATALVATGLQHGATGPGAHPLAEAVLAGTTPVVRLERALHAILLAGHRRGCAATSSGAAPGRRKCRQRAANTPRLGHPRGPRQPAPARRALRRNSAPVQVGRPFPRPRDLLLGCSASRGHDVSVGTVHTLWTSMWTGSGSERKEVQVGDHEILWTAVAQLLKDQVSEAVWFSTFHDVVALDSDASILRLSAAQLSRRGTASCPATCRSCVMHSRSSARRTASCSSRCRPSAIVRRGRPRRRDLGQRRHRIRVERADADRPRRGARGAPAVEHGRQRRPRTRATRSRRSSRARRTSSRSPLRSASPRHLAAATTRCSSTAPPVSARPTCCTRSGTTSTTTTSTTSSATSARRRSSTSTSTASAPTRSPTSSAATATSTCC